MTLPRIALDPVILQILDMISPQKQARKLPRIGPQVKWMLAEQKIPNTKPDYWRERSNHCDPASMHDRLIANP
jgi:hypothetical protein